MMSLFAMPAKTNKQKKLFPSLTRRLPMSWVLHAKEEMIASCSFHQQWQCQKLVSWHFILSLSFGLFWTTVFHTCKLPVFVRLLHSHPQTTDVHAAWEKCLDRIHACSGETWKLRKEKPLDQMSHFTHSSFWLVRLQSQATASSRIFYICEVELGQKVLCASPVDLT